MKRVLQNTKPYSGASRLCARWKLQANLQTPQTRIDNVALYPSQHFDVTNNSYTKYHYTGVEQMGARIGVVKLCGNHLGSASWITDNSGIAIQHLQYMPFGEPFVDQRMSGYNERFTFTGKERDKETGYGYFGARYMDHELMTMWLSVDPMADKYPSISPYAYCAWNPVKLVDPDGRDWYDVDKNGYIRRNKTKSELYPDYDIIYSSHTGKEMIINDKSLLKQLSLSRNDVPKYSNHINYVSSQNKEIGSLFLFLSDNTDVEWGLSGFRLPNKKEYVLTTLHSNQGTFSGSEIRNNECNMQNMIFDIHSHPGKNAIKGASDHDMKTFMERSKYPQAPYPIHYVYHQYTKNLYHYNSSNNCIFIRKIERSSGIDYILNFR